MLKNVLYVVIVLGEDVLDGAVTVVKKINGIAAHALAKFDE